MSELQSLLVGPHPPVILDVRWQFRGPSGYAEYQQGHIPGARFVDLDSDLAGRAGSGGLLPLPEAGQFGAAMRRCGVSRSSSVVTYDASDSSSAARAWWLLGYFGHPDVQVLDGGLRAWVAAGLALSDQEITADEGDFQPRPGNRALVDASGAKRVAEAGVLLDARSAERFRGDVEPYYPVAGHIPGARSAPDTGNLDENGHFLPAARLRRRFAELGAAPGVEVAAYCGAGVAASQAVLALAIAGVGAALYIGSWSDWISDPRRPVATGDASPMSR